MRRYMSALAGAGLLVCLAATVQAQAPPDDGPAAVQAPKPPAAGAQVQYVTRTHTQYKCETRQRVVPTVVSREVEEKYTYTEKVPVTTERKRTETYYVSVSEEEVRQVPVCKVVTEMVTDPCTGKCRAVCRNVTTTQEVRCVVTRQVPRTREVVENVTTEKEVERVGTRRKTVKETVNRTETYLVAVPYTTTVRVPVWPMPAANCCPAPAVGPAAPAAPAAVPRPRVAL
ncbi:MAG TPA: hypothetical protein VFE78_33305 [Gemmataceae bacterium]|nr:hypothetical protein [Gemmataceae bacterium]